MKKMLLTACVFVFAACSDASSPAPLVSGAKRVLPAAASSSAVVRPGHYIVVFRNEVGDPAALARLLVAANKGLLEFTYEHAIKGFAAELSDAAVIALSNHADVDYVEQDGYVSINTTQTGATWGIDRTDQRDLPLSTTYTYTSNGSGVNAYIIDTGIRTTHVEFGGRASSAFDAIGDGNGNVDCNGHGTHVSGTVGGSTYGIAKAVRLFAVRVLDCGGSGSFAQVVAGVDWVTANHISPSVANMSLGGGLSASLDAAVRGSITSGVTYAIAAGNSFGANACLGSPSDVTEALIVGATTITDARASFSNTGTCVDIFAPGESITSSYGTGDNDIAVLSGTSMASPHVAGTVARYLQVNPTATPAAVQSALVTNATLGKVTNPGTGSPNTLLYNGFIDGAVGNLPPVASFTFSCTGLTCSFNSSGSTDDVGITARRFLFGDGTKSNNVVSPSKTYAVAGTYSVTLDVQDGGGLTGTQTQLVTVTGAGNQAPVANFTVSCTGLSCTFDSNSSTDDVGITGRRWFFGDGSRGGNLVVATKTYAVGGTYSVQLDVQDAGRLVGTKTIVITVP